MSMAAEAFSVSVPIWFGLDQDGVGDALVDAFLQDLRVGHETGSSPTELDLLAERPGEQFPTFPVPLAHAVLDGDDGVLPGEIGQVLRKLRRGEVCAFSDSRS